MSNLKTQLIRLAYENPSLRKHLLPLVTGSSSEGENEYIRWYISPTGYSVRVTDLTNAGRRGKIVDEFAVWDKYGRHQNDGLLRDHFHEVINSSTTYQDALNLLRDFERLEESKRFEVGYYRTKGVAVRPPEKTSRTIRIHTPKLFVEATPVDFRIHDLVDRYNEPRAIPATRGTKTSARKAYLWLLENEDSLKSMRFAEVLDGFRKAGISYHQYYGVD